MFIEIADGHGCVLAHSPGEPALGGELCVYRRPLPGVLGAWGDWIPPGGDVASHPGWERLYPTAACGSAYRRIAVEDWDVFSHHIVLYGRYTAPSAPPSAPPGSSTVQSIDLRSGAVTDYREGIRDCLARLLLMPGPAGVEYSDLHALTPAANLSFHLPRLRCRVSSPVLPGKTQPCVWLVLRFMYSSVQ